MAKEVSREDAAAELLRRRKAREDLGEYMDYVSGKTPPLHLRLLVKKIHECMDRKITRLIVAMPPGHAKTTTISYHLPAFYLSRFHEHCIIAVTHTQDLAKSNGRRARNIMASDEHRNLFPDVQVSEDSAAADAWETTAKGIYLGFGVGSTVVGRRANLVIIDDPLKGVEDADSELIRDKLWQWYGGDLFTRIVGGGLIIIVATRYHLDDLSGRLLAASKQPGGEKWDTLILPALAEKDDVLGRKEGDALWPDWMSKEALLNIKAQPAMTPRMFASLYQQRPVIEGGNLVKRPWIRLWHQSEPPDTTFIIQSWDTAVTGKSTSAYSACLTVGVFTDTDGAPSMILLSRWRGRVEYPDLRKMAIRLHWNYLDDRFDMPMRNPGKRSPDVCLVEDKATGRPLINDLARAGIFATGFAVQKYGDKTARLRLCLDILEAGRFYVPGQPPNYTVPRRWADEFVQSLINFPNADSRDDVDAFSQLVIRLKTSGWVHQASEGPKEPDYRSEQNQRGAIY